MSVSALLDVSMGWVDRTPMWPEVAAAIGLSLIPIGGVAVHVSRGESRVIGLNIDLLVMSVITAWLAR